VPEYGIFRLQPKWGEGQVHCIVGGHWWAGYAVSTMQCTPVTARVHCIKSTDIPGAGAKKEENVVTSSCTRYAGRESRIDSSKGFKTNLLVSSTGIPPWESCYGGIRSAHEGLLHMSRGQKPHKQPRNQITSMKLRDLEWDV
jgi:hypothetical protein